MVSAASSVIADGRAHDPFSGSERKRYVQRPCSETWLLRKILKASMAGEVGHLRHWSPTFLSPGTGFVEDNFSTDGVVGVGDGSGGNGSDGEQQMKLRWLATSHLLLCGPVPNRPWTATCPWPGVRDP